MQGRLFQALLFLILFTFSLFSYSVAEDVRKVEAVIDGDTLLLTNGEYVRLIGIDTPETKHP